MELSASGIKGAPWFLGIHAIEQRATLVIYPVGQNLLDALPSQRSNFRGQYFGCSNCETVQAHSYTQIDESVTARCGLAVPAVQVVEKIRSLTVPGYPLSARLN